MFLCPPRANLCFFSQFSLLIYQIFVCGLKLPDAYLKTIWCSLSSIAGLDFLPFSPSDVFSPPVLFCVFIVRHCQVIAISIHKISNFLENFLKSSNADCWLSNLLNFSFGILVTFSTCLLICRKLFPNLQTEGHDSARKLAQAWSVGLPPV